VHTKLLRDGVVIQASYNGEEHKIYFSREGGVYFNIRGMESVIQVSLRRGECNLLYIYLFEEVKVNYITNQNVTLIYYPIDEY